jgi:hypothetical protein
MARLPSILKLARTSKGIRKTVSNIPNNKAFDGMRWETTQNHADKNYYSLIVERDVIKKALDPTGRIERWEDRLFWRKKIASI